MKGKEKYIRSEDWKEVNTDLERNESNVMPHETRRIKEIACEYL